MSDYRTIVATTDFSEASMEAVRRAVDLAARLGSHLILTYVVEDRLPPMVVAVSTEPVDRIIERHVHTAETNLAAFVQEHYPGTKIETRVLVGVPHAAIVKFAEERGADLIVVGTRGHGLLGHALLGSTAERVVHHAPCPVLVVRTAG